MLVKEKRTIISDNLPRSLILNHFYFSQLVAIRMPSRDQDQGHSGASCTSLRRQVAGGWLVDLPRREYLPEHVLRRQQRYLLGGAMPTPERLAAVRFRPTAAVPPLGAAHRGLRSGGRTRSAMGR